MRYLSGRAITLTHTFYDDESALTLAGCSVTVWAEGNSTPVVNAQAATEDTSTHEWSIAIPAQSQGRYTVLWDGGTTQDADAFEVVGAFYFSIPELRASDPDLTQARYPTDKVKSVREQVETEFENITGRSFVPRTQTVTAYGDGSNTILLGVFDATLKSVTVDGVAETDLTVWELDETGTLTYSGVTIPGADANYYYGDYPAQGEIYRNCKVECVVDYGFKVTPADVKTAALTYARYLLAAETSGIPDRATQFIAESGGQFTLATPGLRGSQTGIPSVDAVLKRYTFSVLLSAYGIA